MKKLLFIILSFTTLSMYCSHELSAEELAAYEELEEFRNSPINGVNTDRKDNAYKKVAIDINPRDLFLLSLLNDQQLNNIKLLLIRLWIFNKLYNGKKLEAGNELETTKKLSPFSFCHATCLFDKEKIKLKQLLIQSKRKAVRESLDPKENNYLTNTLEQLLYQCNISSRELENLDKKHITPYSSEELLCTILITLKDIARNTNPNILKEATQWLLTRDICLFTEPEKQFLLQQISDINQELQIEEQYTNARTKPIYKAFFDSYNIQRSPLTSPITFESMLNHQFNTTISFNQEIVEEFIKLTKDPTTEINFLHHNNSFLHCVIETCLTNPIILPLLIPILQRQDLDVNLQGFKINPHGHAALKFKHKKNDISFDCPQQSTPLNVLLNALAHRKYINMPCSSTSQIINLLLDKGADPQLIQNPEELSELLGIDIHNIDQLKNLMYRQRSDIEEYKQSKIGKLLEQLKIKDPTRFQNLFFIINHDCYEKDKVVLTDEKNKEHKIPFPNVNETVINLYNPKILQIIKKANTLKKITDIPKKLKPGIWCC